MVPPEMFPKVIRKSDESEMWVHIMTLQSIVHIDANEYELKIGGEDIRVLIDDPNKTFPFTVDDATMQ